LIPANQRTERVTRGLHGRPRAGDEIGIGLAVGALFSDSQGVLKAMRWLDGFLSLSDLARKLLQGYPHA
jgi:hypothetical protein